MNKNTLFFIIVLVIAGLNLGTVRKAEDPIRDTQTNPIGIQQKMEEEKDGVKGPLMYHVQYNPKDAFFIEPPFEKEKKASEVEKAKEEQPATVSDWWEEKPAQDTATSPQEPTVTEPIATEEQKPLPESATAKVDSGAEEGKAPKDDNYWW